MSVKISLDAINANSSDGAHEEADDEKESRPAARRKPPEEDSAIQVGASTARLSTELARAFIDTEVAENTNWFVARKPVNRLIREILQEVRSGFRLREEAVDALHHAVEDYAIELQMECNALAHHTKRSFIMPNDPRLSLRLRF